MMAWTLDRLGHALKGQLQPSVKPSGTAPLGAISTDTRTLKQGDVFVALRGTIAEFGIPAEPFLNLLTAFRQDQRQSHYETFDDLLGYCRNSADPVGRLVLYLARRHEQRLLSWSDAICTGLQLANFWQDTARDLAKGRVYIPRRDLAEFGVDNPIIYGLLEAKAAYAPGNAEAFNVTIYARLLRD